MPFLFAALAVAARLPFLLSEKIPFDSDEAVQGLMARHILNGELPAFFWGQAYKGVPEAYVSAGAFALFGSTVTVLKSVTLLFFAAYVGLNYVLVRKFLGPWMAIAASLLLIFGPPPIVQWSLSASAEYVLIMLVGTIVLLLATEIQQQAIPGRRLLASLGFVVGLGLWIHQMFLFYLIPIVVIFVRRARWWRERRFGAVRMPAIVLAVIAGFYLGLAVIAFFTGGVSLRLGSMALSATAPQKMLRITIGVAVLAIAAHLLSNVSRDAWKRAGAAYWPLAAGFFTGYLPVLIYSVAVEPARSPARVANLRTLIDAAPDIFGNIIPILAGFKLATLERVPVHAAFALVPACALAAYFWSIRYRLTAILSFDANDTTLEKDFFPLFMIVVPALLVISGAYIDTQSYRYALVYYAGLVVALAAGSYALGKQNIIAASILAGVLACVFGLQQILWYEKLSPDVESRRVIECMTRQRLRGGFADYWTSYKLTFLSNEHIIFAPTTGVDRYPAYTAYVRALPQDAVTKSASCVVSP
jgi:hypothetical protein